MDQLNTTLALAQQMDAIKLLLVVIAIALVALIFVVGQFLRNQRAALKELNQRKLTRAKTKDAELKAQSNRESVLANLLKDSVGSTNKLTAAIESLTQSHQRRNNIDEQQTQIFAAQTEAVNSVIKRVDQGVARIDANTSAVQEIAGKADRNVSAIQNQTETIGKLEKAVTNLPDQLQAQIVPILEMLKAVDAGVKSIEINTTATQQLASSQISETQKLVTLLGSASGQIKTILDALTSQAAAAGVTAGGIGAKSEPLSDLPPSAAIVLT